MSRKEKSMFKTTKQKIISMVICGIYIFLLIWLILFKFSTNITDLDHIRNLNLIPFKGSLVVNGRISMDEIIYNILVFVPFGVYVNIFYNKWSIGKKILILFSLSVLFEVVQFVFAIGASDITDIIGNTLGGILGFFFYMLFKKLFQGKCITVINVIGLIVELLALIMLAILFAVNI